MGHSNAENLTAFLVDKTAAEYLGCFMNTNIIGSPPRVNGLPTRNLDVDIDPGTLDFVRWDAATVPPGSCSSFPCRETWL